VEAGGRVAAGGGGALEVFLAALRLGLTSFGGPVAHIGFFRDEYVRRRAWLDERSFGELVAITTLLPGPSSSQLGIAVGAHRAGTFGGLAAWAGFTLPSALAMLVLGLAARDLDVAGAGWLHGLELAAAAVVLTAVVGMARTLAPDLPRVAVAAVAAAAALAFPGSATQVAVIAAAGAVGALAWRRGGGEVSQLHLRFPVSRRQARASLALFAALLGGLPLLREATGSHAVAFVDAFYRAGALVFGGGHVVLPLLDQAVVRPGWLAEDVFLAGYGAAQALPGPLFTFAAFAGAAAEPAPNGAVGAAIALVTIFLPSFLLLAGVLPAWGSLRRHATARAAVTGIGAGVVGLLAAAFWSPVLTTAVRDAADAAVLAVLVVALRVLPAWAVVVVAAVIGAAAL
jgi:chromate transporter